jgi:hypothetical protein
MSPRPRRFEVRREDAAFDSIQSLEIPECQQQLRQPNVPRPHRTVADSRGSEALRYE